MANFTPKQIVLSNINNGNEYNDNDGIQPNMVNDCVEGVAYCDEQRQALVQVPDNTEVANIGEPNVSFVDTIVNGRTYKKFKFSNLKGEKGEAGVGATVVQTTGNSEDNVMSQKAVSDELDTKQDTLTFDTTPTAASSNPVTSGGVYNWNKVAVKDTRNDNPTPNEVSEQSVSFDFKGGSTIGLPTWQTLMTVKGWTNTNWNTNQIAFDSSNNDYIRYPKFRYGRTDTWSSWMDILIATSQSNNYIKLSNGLIIQWGNVTITSYSRDFTFPLAFSNTDYYFNLTNTDQLNIIRIMNKTATKCSLVQNSSTSATYMWFAIGF